MIRIGIIGVTGYTGMELVRLISGHPGAVIKYASSLSMIGRKVEEAIPSVPGITDVVVEMFDPAKALENAEFFFLCLPHGESMEVAGVLYEKGAGIVDLSADFRLSDPTVYEQWYGEHTKKGRLREAVYGMTELHRDEVRGARLVANPGCYPTSIVLGLAPLLEAGAIHVEGIIADSKSGISGAGREPRPDLHFPEVFGDCSAYSLAGMHRHISEIEQELEKMAGKQVRVTFSPHLLPVSRGILSTLYAKPARDLDDRTLCDIYLEAYRDEPFLRISNPGASLPSLRNVRGTNICAVAPRMDPRTGTVVVISCLDNLVKGAAGQAVQNMNLMTGQPETTGLLHPPHHP
jgi:N-acetyl-gamma-glutamyl-phosphate reductase